jgi:hypothetical protein
VANEIYFNQAHQVKQLLDMACQFKMLNPSQEKFDSKSKNVLIECLIEKYYSVKEIRSPEMRKAASMD